MNKRDEEQEKWELMGAQVWASRSPNSVYGQYNKVLHDVMCSVINGDNMEIHQDQANPTALLKAADLLVNSGHKETAKELIEQVATMQVLSLAGPLAHRLKKAGRRKNPHWPLIMKLAENEIKNHPHRNYSARHLANIVRERFKKLKPGIRESEIPKMETIMREVKDLAKVAKHSAFCSINLD